MDEQRHHPARNVPYLGHRGPALEEAVAWVEASAAAPCPRCGAVAGCSVAGDGEFVRCRLIPSRYPVAGGGWLHRPPEPAAGTEARGRRRRPAGLGRAGATGTDPPA